MNLEKVRILAQSYEQLKTEQKERIDAQVKTAMAHLEKEPKSLAWRLRARVGDRVKWYKDVDEVR
jgi:F0F1-type ATP synthase delta subunit